MPWNDVLDIIQLKNEEAEELDKKIDSAQPGKQRTTKTVERWK